MDISLKDTNTFKEHFRIYLIRFLKKKSTWFFTVLYKGASLFFILYYGYISFLLTSLCVFLFFYMEIITLINYFRMKNRFIKMYGGLSTDYTLNLKEDEIYVHYVDHQITLQWNQFNRVVVGKELVTFMKDGIIFLTISFHKSTEDFIRAVKDYLDYQSKKRSNVTFDIRS